MSDAIGLFETEKDFERFRESAPTVTDHDERTAKLRRDVATETVLTVNFDNAKPRLDYTFTSLISALHIMFALNVAAPSVGQVRLCSLADCAQSFNARYDRARYCCDLHANRDRQRAFAQRQQQKRKHAMKGKSRGR